VVIKTLDLAADDLLKVLATSLQLRGIQIADILTRSQKMGADKLSKEFNLSIEERNMLYQVLQLKAQAAVEAIRFAAESNSTSELTDDDIEFEIQETKN
jgi:hypothetical protein